MKTQNKVDAKKSRKIECKNENSQKLDSISKENHCKFDKILLKAHKLDTARDIYPIFVKSQIESNVNLTLKFYEGKYKNTTN